MYFKAIKLNGLCRSNITKLWLACVTLFVSVSAFSAEDSTTQDLRVIIPKLALIDVNNTYLPLIMSFSPMTNAGDNFATITASSAYDVTSNIGGLRLYGKTNVDLETTHNLKLEVNESGSFYHQLTTIPQRVSTQGRQAQKNQPLNYRASPADSNKTISHGIINVVVTYTLVEQ